jgi:hypothetical protein
VEETPTDPPQLADFPLRRDSARWGALLREALEFLFLSETVYQFIM